MKVTSIESLKKVAQGEIIELPGWIDGEGFNARVKRPSLMSMVTKGEIPNALMTTAMDLFYNRVSKDTKLDLKKMTEIQNLVVEAALVEPSPKQLNEVGLELTDEQSLLIFNYTQQGVKALDRFRKEQSNSASVEAVEAIQAKTE